MRADDPTNRKAFYGFLLRSLVSAIGMIGLAVLLAYAAAKSYSFMFAPPSRLMRTPAAMMAEHNIFRMTAMIFLIFSLFQFGRMFIGDLCNRLLYHQIFDRPNQRSMHRAPVPRGGGWAFAVNIAAMFLFLIGWQIALRYEASPELLFSHPQIFFLYLRQDIAALPELLLAPGLIALTAISWMDDLKNVTARRRLLAQIAASACGLLALPGLPDAFPLIPAWLLYPLAAVAWVGFINIYNFMDGIDGITATETGMTAGSILLIYSVFGGAAHIFPSGQAAYPILWLLCVLFGTSMAFLAFNWHPARIFLGDVGSVPIGYLIGFCLLFLAQSGYGHIALILPLYYLADGGLTLLRRILRGEKFWEAHRTHFYQRAAQAAGRHDTVVLRIALCNLMLSMIAGLSLLYDNPWLCLAAPLPVAVLLHKMAHWQSAVIEIKRKIKF